MSTDELKNEVRTLSDEERHQLSAFLVELELQNDSDCWQTVRRRANETAKEKWVSLDRLKRE